MKTIVCAYHNIGCAGLKALLRNGYDVKAVFTYIDDPAEGSWFDSVSELAARHNIPVYCPDDINHPLWVKRIQEMQPDILFSFYYRDLLRTPLLDIPKQGCFNLHGSLLPKYRGCAPINWAIINGERETGVTLHAMVAKADAGDILGQQAVEIGQNDTALALNHKLVEASASLLDRLLPGIKQNEIAPIAQHDQKATTFGRRRPADGEIDWTQSATRIHNLVRALAHPYPGAFTHCHNNKLKIWEARKVHSKAAKAPPGTILDTNPLRVVCGEGELEIHFGAESNGAFLSGTQLAEELGLVAGTRLGKHSVHSIDQAPKTRVLILGVNGFIGNALTERLLSTGNYEVHGLDLNDSAISRFAHEPDFYFHEGDITISREWVEYHIKKCDVVLPLIAIATPIEYVRNPLKVFELDFEENLQIVRLCAKYKKRIIFPSTSEVYGMCADPEFDEDHSPLITGPINKQRWIYSTSKQLLDRVIWAYHQEQGLSFTLFRPFNWIGPRLDTLASARIGSSRAITQLILNLVEGTPIQLIDGGAQKRCFTDVRDGVECLFRIIEEGGERTEGRIINIGNPENEASIKGLAEVLTKLFESHPLRSHFPPFAGIKEIESHSYYGEGYQDVQHRRPSIRNASRLLGWNPEVGLEKAVAGTLDFFLRDLIKHQNASATLKHLSVASG